MSHVNIEFAHIYSDQDPGDEQKRSAREAYKYATQLTLISESYCLTAMVDEYHPDRSNLILTDYLDFLETLDTRPHYVVMEGDLRTLAYRVLYSIPKKERMSLTKWINDKEKFPCSLLTATWYLCRLGLILPSPPAIEIGQVTVPFVADRIVTVLPKKYKDNEDRVMELIAMSPWKEHTNRIHYLWIE